MGKKRSIALSILLVVILGGLTWEIWRNREPVYKGKPLSYWLKGMADSPATGKDYPKMNEAVEALEQIGTNATPTLLKMLRAHDGQLKLKLFTLVEKQRFIKIRFMRSETLNIAAGNGFLSMGSGANPALPELIKIYDQCISFFSQRVISSIFYHLGPEAKAAVPSLIRGTASPDDYVRNEAINALGHIRSDPDIVVPALTKCLNDSVPRNRQNAAFALGAYGTNAIKAVPQLVAMLKDPAINSNSTPFFANVRAGVEFALENISPEAAAKAPLK